jgi:Lrp/AsnC family transcriptional regulator, leucine-responsive regulatory protein
MNRSRYVTRPLDATDRAIIAALTVNGRMTVRELAEQIGLSSPSITERIHKLEDAGAIRGYTVLVDTKVFGLGIAAHVRMRAMPGEVKRVAQMLIDTPEVVEADRVTGEVIDRFQPFASADTSIILSSTVVPRLPKI